MVGNKDSLLPEEVNRIMREGNDLQKEVLTNLALNTPEGRIDAVKSVVNAVLKEKSGQKLSALVDKLTEGAFKSTATFANNVCAVIHTGGANDNRANLVGRIETPVNAGVGTGYAHVLTHGRKVTKTETEPFDELLGPTLKKLLGGTVTCRLVLIPHTSDHATNVADKENVATNALTALSNPFQRLYNDFANAHITLTKDGWKNANEVGILFETGEMTTTRDAANVGPDVMVAPGAAGSRYKIVRLGTSKVGEIPADVIKSLNNKVSEKYWQFCDKAMDLDPKEADPNDLNG